MAVSRASRAHPATSLMRALLFQPKSRFFPERGLSPGNGPVVDLALPKRPGPKANAYKEPVCTDSRGCVSGVRVTVPPRKPAE